MKVAINYSAQSINVEVANGTTAGQVRKNPNYQAVLGFGASTIVKAGGIQLADDTVLTDGANITIETACQSKA